MHTNWPSSATPKPNTTAVPGGVVQYAGSARHREPAGGLESSAELDGTVILTLALLYHTALVWGAWP